MRTFARRAANTWAGNSREACLGRLRNCCCAVSDSFMKLAQVGSVANKANAADPKNRAADCSVGKGMIMKKVITCLAVAVLLSGCGGTRTHDVADVTKAEVIVLKYTPGQGPFHSLSVTGFGEIQGDAEISLILNGDPYKTEKLSG